MALAKTERENAAAGVGPLGKADDGEPVFILRGQDRLAASLVWEWARRASRTGCPVAKIIEAQEIAEAMEKWPKRKDPD